MPAPDRSKGSGGKARQSRSRRLRASAETFDPELFATEQTSSFAPRPTPRQVGSETFAETTQGGFSKQALKFVLGIFLMPIAFILTGAFLGTLKKSVHDGLLGQQSFGSLVAGMLLFVLLFVLLPRRILMIPYVFGHEVTHAVWVKIFGGNVANRFHVSLEGGHVLTDRVNTWIVLSPYFFPIYAILVATLYGALLFSGGLLDIISHPVANQPSLFHSIASLQWLFLLVIGLTLAFHLTFTFLLLTKSQPDLHYGGTFFSLMVIYLINLLILTGLLLLTSGDPLWGPYGDSLERSIEVLVILCGQIWIFSAEGVDALRKVLGN
jgi:hypothetical protein